MSFKREGDDPSQLHVLKVFLKLELATFSASELQRLLSATEINRLCALLTLARFFNDGEIILGHKVAKLQKRRVADLLAHYIPEDEALLLRDGRYACTVCFHRPVFDTLNMLTVHRSGKKHLASLQKFYGKKRSLEDEVWKRHHEAYLRAEETGSQVSPGPAPLLLQTKKIAQNALLKTAPYNSCCRRSRPAGNDFGSGRSRTAADVRATEGAELWNPSHVTQVDRDRPIGADATPSAHLPGSSNTPADLQEEASPRHEKKSKRKASSGMALSSQPEDPTPEKRQALEHYLRLKSSGWIQDGSGKWTKDANVEFDSDEEEPPALTPP